MSYVHLAHDCHIGNGVILGNSVQLAGHVIDRRQGDSLRTFRRASVRAHRPARFIGGCSRVSKDIPPFLKAVGNPVKLYGLEQRWTSAERISERSRAAS